MGLRDIRCRFWNGYWHLVPFIWLRRFQTIWEGRKTVLRFRPRLIHSGNKARSEELLDAYFSVGGEKHALGLHLWQADALEAEASRKWWNSLHAFDYLRDLKSAGDEEARLAAQNMVFSWIESHKNWQEIAWEPLVLSRRIKNWLGTSDFFLSAADARQRHRFFSSLHCQAIHLDKVHALIFPDHRRLMMSTTALLASTALDRPQAVHRKQLRRLLVTIAHLRLTDGAMKERSPRALCRSLEALLDLRALYRQAGQRLSPLIERWVGELGGQLRQLSKHQGQLAHFHEQPRISTDQVRRLIERADPDGQFYPPRNPNGFFRLETRRALVILDGNGLSSGRYAVGQFASLGAFEFQVGSQPFIVNVGHAFDDSFPWEQSLRTACHSTWEWSGADSSEILSTPKQGLWWGKRKAKNADITFSQNEAFTSLAVRSQAFQALGGGTFYRSIHLAKDSRLLEGEDRVDGAREGLLKIRFHLHPGVEAFPLEAGQRTVLRLPKGSPWWFEQKGAEVALLDSLYFEQGTRRSCQQIELSLKPRGGEGRVTWAFKREDRTN